jgi:cobalamin biosynthesis Co2+ chelatase CbiK
MESARKPQTEPKQHQDWTNVWTTLSAGDAQSQQAPYFRMIGRTAVQQAPLFMMSSGAAVAADMAQQHHHHWRNSTSSAGDAQGQQAPFFTMSSAGDAQGQQAPFFMMSSGAAVAADMAQQHHHHWRNSGDHAFFEAGFDTSHVPVQSG